jgi:hypothetical protein
MPGQGAGSRQIVRVMQRWQTGRAIERAAHPPKDRFRLHIPSWAYPVAAAAIIIIGFAIWGMNVEKHSTTDNTSMSWTGGEGGSLFDAPPADNVSPVAEQYAKLEEALWLAMLINVRLIKVSDDYTETRHGANITTLRD